MASKSKKRRRVLGASCILAALIIAGSSFAWFTSKDEVTNRLSANADYNVKIVESFAPPANWIPGQEVNKDVYATNTGTIGAFVKEEVSGVMTLTKETRVATRDDNCTTLTEAERYSVEAGSYLALVKPDSGTSTHKAGEKIVSFTTNSTDPNGYTANTVVTDFTPDVSGIYVFRRKIEVASTGTDPQSETFTYDSYYYDKTSGKYYKTALTSITPDNVADYAGDKVRTDGNLTDATVTYFKDVTKTVTPKLTYDAAGNKLIAKVEGSSYVDNTALQNAGKAYDDAIHAYQTALAEQSRALAEDTVANGTLKSALDTLNADKIAEAEAKKAFEEALANYLAIQSELNAANTELGSASDPSTVAGKNKAALEALFGNSYTGTDAPAGYDAWVGSEAQTYNGLWEEMKNAYLEKEAAPADEAGFLEDLQAWLTSSDADAAVIKTRIGYTGSETKDQLVGKLTYADLQKFKNWITANKATEENHDKYLKEADYLIAKKKYDDKVKEFKTNKDLYDSLTSRVGDSSSGLTQDLNNAKSGLVGTDTSLDTLLTAGNYTNIMNSANTAVDSLTKDSADPTSTTDLYSKWKQAAIDTEKAQAAYNDAKDNSTTGTNTTSANLATANKAVATAKAQLDLASKLYGEAVTEYNAAHDIIININLNDVVTKGGEAGKWQILPTTVAGDKAVFYYTNILEGGETSNKLIDSVTLDSSVTQDMYKSFDFDLNVALKSAQITYANDNETILATATPTELGATATLKTPTDINTAITWSANP